MPGPLTGGSSGLSEAQVNALIDAKVPYLVYTALLTQTGSGAPLATVLQNTLGGTVVWTFDAAGSYTGTLAGAFTVSKTACFISGVAGSGDGDDDRTAVLTRGDNNTVLLHTFRGGVGLIDDVLNNAVGTMVEIRVYP